MNENDERNDGKMSNVMPMLTRGLPGIWQDSSGTRRRRTTNYDGQAVNGGR